MNVHLPEDQTFNIENTLFSESWYGSPTIPGGVKPRYNPSINTIFLPKLENDFVRRIASFHENVHKDLNIFPASCFLQTLARLIYYEFTRNKYKESSDISVLFPENNPTVRMLKAFWETAFRGNKYVQEAHSLRQAIVMNDDIDPLDSLMAENRDPKKVEDAGIKYEEKDMPGFKKLYERYSFIQEHPDVLQNIPTYYLNSFPYDGPSFIPDLPLTEDGCLDSSRISEEVADIAIEKFRKKYRQLPFSPRRRFLEILKVIERMIKSDTEINHSSLVNSIKESSVFNFEEFPELSEVGAGVQKCHHCPVDTLHSMGISIPWDDFGSPSGYFDYSKYKRLNCRIPRRLGVSWNELSQKDQTIDRLTRIELEIEKTVPPKLIFRHGEVKLEETKIYRSKGYVANWPLSSFLTASEFLRHFVFHSTERFGSNSKLILVESVNFPADNVTRAPEPPPLGEEQVLDLSPFISLKTTNVENDERSDLYYHLS